MLLLELFPFNTDEGVPFHANLNENNMYFPHSRYKIWILYLL
jgi:hypothetical protein